MICLCLWEIGMILDFSKWGFICFLMIMVQFYCLIMEYKGHAMKFCVHSLR